MTLKLGHDTSEAVLSVFDNLENIIHITRYFHWQAIRNDPDDDKLVDCAIAANAICIVKEDKHFKVLLSLDFPKIATMSIAQFTHFYNT